MEHYSSAAVFVFLGPAQVRIRTLESENAKHKENLKVRDYIDSRDEPPL
jgi:hypothetical protein